MKDRMTGYIVGRYEKAVNFMNTVVKVILPSMGVRPMTLFMKDHFKNKPLVGCEIGVDRGLNALSFLTSLNMDLLYLVDPYKVYTDDDAFYTEFERHKDFASGLLKYRGSQIKWLYMNSKEASEILSDSDFLDFVYIDGNHQYEFVKQDIEIFLPRVRSNGIVGGHDYTGEHRGVVKAVNEFVDLRGYNLYTKDTDWWVVKK